MGVMRKFRVIHAIAFVLALILLWGGYQVWLSTGTRSRPWHLEAYLESRLAECRTGPGAFLFRKEYEQIASRAGDARWCLFEEGRRWWLVRDYSGCVFRLLSACQEAQLLRLKLAQRQQEQNVKSRAFLAALRHELGSGGQGRRMWSRFELRSIERERALSLVKQADFLIARGEAESALGSILRAWVSWQHFNHVGAREFARFEDEALRRKWNQQAENLLRWTRQSGRRAVLVDKLEHLCLLLYRGQVEKSYTANLGRNWYRTKVQALDASTPEGEYKVRRMNAASKYGLALLLDYPNASDQARFHQNRKAGMVSPGALIGGNIEIHGGGRPDTDWTDGCVSLDNRDMRELYRYAYAGMPVTIVGTATLTSNIQDRSGASR
jgi:hypothetical protein